MVKTLVTGQFPFDIAVNPNTNMIYVANSGSDTVSVIAGGQQKNNVVKSLNIGWPYYPKALEVDTKTDEVYVMNTIGSSHYILSLDKESQNNYGDEFPVGKDPLGLSYDSINRLLYVVNGQSDTVSIVDTNTNTVDKTIPAGKNPVDVVVDNEKNRIYVANNSSNTVSIVDTNTNTVDKTIPAGKNPWSIGLDKNYNMIYVANSGSNDVSVIDRNTIELIGNIKVGLKPLDLAVNSQNHLLYVPTNDSLNVINISSTTGNFKSSIVKHITEPNDYITYTIFSH